MANRSSFIAASMAVALLGGCGGSQPPTGALGTKPQSGASFPHYRGSRLSQKASSISDGSGPSSRLVALDGSLYGTTSIGGANDQGTVYRITTSGVENVVYSFATGCRRHKKCSDGVSPNGLVRVSSTLYGTTIGGGLGPCFNPYGPNGCGTVFSVTLSGAESVLYSFESGCRRAHGCSDAYYPSGLSAIDATLYGTSYYGGKHGFGTVYSVTTSGIEKVIYSFPGGSYGSYPNGGLIEVDGTTFYGGAQGAGFVFSMSETGRTKTLYSFDAPSGGGSADASGSLIDVSGVLYGTTGVGGAYNKGTAFSILKSGTVNVLHSFGNGSDGEHPDSGLLNVKGILYGETTGGGTGMSASGTVFSLTTSGKEKVLHSFASSDGSPGGGLTLVKGILYGTTGTGGTCDGGTVFSVTPSGTLKVLHSFC